MTTNKQPAPTRGRPRTMPPDSTALVFRLTPQLYERLRQHSHNHRSSMAAIIRQAIEQYLEETT